MPNRIAPNSVSMTLVGTCSFHGRAQDQRIPSTLTYLDESPRTMERVKGDLMRLRARLTVKLSDHGVTGPTGGANTVGLKVADVMPVRVTIFGSTERPPDPLKPDTGGSATRPAGSPASQPSAGTTSGPSILLPPTR